MNEEDEDADMHEASYTLNNYAKSADDDLTNLDPNLLISKVKEQTLKDDFDE